MCLLAHNSNIPPASYAAVLSWPCAGNPANKVLRSSAILFAKRTLKTLKFDAKEHPVRDLFVLLKPEHDHCNTLATCPGLVLLRSFVVRPSTIVRFFFVDRRPIRRRLSIDSSSTVD